MATSTRKTATRRTVNSEQAAQSRRARQQERAAKRQAKQERRTMRERVGGIGGFIQEHQRAFIIVFGVLMVLGMLYGPTRGYYVAARSSQDLQRYLEAVNEQNESLRNDLERLQSEEGIEDEAHRRGYVSEGETGVVVEGLPDEDLAAMLGEIELPDTRPWYIKVLDVVFFYNENSWQ